MKAVKWILNSIDLKVSSVIIALFVWLHVATERTYDTDYTARLEFVNPPRGWTLVGDPPEEISLRLRGTGKQLISQRLYGEPIATIELPRTKSYHVKVNLEPDQIILARVRGLEIASIISPTEIELEMDTLVRKNVPVEPMVRGTPRDMYVQMGKVELDPAEVELLGGRSRIRTIVELNTEPISVESEAGPVERMVAIALPAGAGYRAKPDSVLARVMIDRLTDMVVEKIPIKVTNLKPRRKVKISSEFANVILRGPESVIHTADSASVTLSLDLDGYDRGSHLVPLKVTRPEDFEVLSIEPDLIQVTIE